MDKRYIPSILEKSTFNVITADNNVKKVVEFGMSSNKSFEYLASGKPIICTFSEGKYGYIEKNEAGIAKDIKNPNEFCDIIEQFDSNTTERYAQLSDNARRAAKQYDFKKLTNDLEKVIKFVCKKVDNI